LLLPSLAADRIILYLSFQQILAKFCNSSSIAMKIVHSATTDPEDWRVNQLAFALSSGPSLILYCNSIILQS